MTVMRFDCHRGITPLLWAFAALATTELLVVHLVLSLRWPRLAWGLTLITVISLVWLVHWIGSFRRRPHELGSDSIRLRCGTLREIELPLNRISQVRSSWSAGEHRGSGVANLVPIAYPNRLFDLDPPIRGPRGSMHRVAVRVDEPEKLDFALAQLGVKIA
ncbi:MAG: hypothetical protein ABR588_00305 [Sphingomicrobium sp.]|nr:hypothetical protein [Sphingomonadales bacterium]